MVWEERFYAEPKDIISIRLTCKKCFASSTIPLRGNDTVHSACSYCHEQLLPGGSSDFKAIHRLLEGLNTLRQREKDAACEIHLELPGKLGKAGDK